MEERTPEKKTDFVVRGLYKCYELEAEADSNVKALLASYRPRLKELGADTAVLDQLWLYYCDDKQVEKAYYLKEYM